MHKHLAKVNHNHCRAQRSGARLGNHDAVYIVLQSQPQKHQMYVMVLAPGAPHKFGTCDPHLLLGVSKYVSNRARYLDLEPRWRYQVNEFIVNVQSSFYRSVNGLEQAPLSNLA